MVFLFPDFYFLLLDISYFVKTGNELCTGPEIIDTLEECEVASKELGQSFEGTESAAEYPKGCYEWSEKTYWNTHSSGGGHSESYSICKKGEKME